MILSLVLLFAMVRPLPSLETPFQLANCTVTPLSLIYPVSPNSKVPVCAPFSIQWKVKFMTDGASLFNASLPNVLCVIDNSTVYFNGSVSFSGTRASLTVCRVADGACAQVNLGYTGIYVLNSTVISAGTNLNQPLWETFGIMNPDFTVCDSVLGTPLNVTAFDDLNTVGCTFSDSYPARSIKLQSPLSLPTGTYTIILAASSCDGSGAKSGPLTLIVTSSPMTATPRVSQSAPIATTYVAMTTSATPSISNAPSNGAGAASTIYIGVAAGSVSLFVVVVVVVVVATALVKKNRLCTLKVVQEDGQEENDMKDLTVEGAETGDPMYSKPSQNVHTLQTEGSNDQVQYGQIETPLIVVIAEEDNQWYKELAENLAQHHHCKSHFIAWTSNTGGFSRQFLEDCAQVYVVWKGPLEDKQSSDFHSFVCELEMKHAVQRLGLVQLGASTTAIKHCGHRHTRIALVSSDGADVRICAEWIIKLNTQNHNQTTPAPKTIQMEFDRIREEQQKHTTILEKLVISSSSTLETVKKVDTNVVSLTVESRQTVDAVQTLILKEWDPQPM